MTQDPHDKEYLNLFKPKASSPDEGGTPSPSKEETAAAAAQSFPGVDHLGMTQPTQAVDADFTSPEQGPEKQADYPFSAPPRDNKQNMRTIGLIAGAGCLLLVLAAVVIFAFVQVFLDRDDKEIQNTPAPTDAVVLTPAPTAPVSESPLIVPLVSSDQVRVPVALPERLVISDTVFTVQAINTPDGAWPVPPAQATDVHWAYGTMINYIFGLASTPETQDLTANLQVGDSLSLLMSTGLTLKFNVTQIQSGEMDQETTLDQISPQLTLALLDEDPTQRQIVIATFFEDEPGSQDLLLNAVVGSVGTPVERGPARIMVINAYQATAQEAGLPPGTGYLLIDFSVENLGNTVLRTEFFQTFVSDTTGERYPLTVPANQFTHHGLPNEPLAPAEMVIGSAGYLVPESATGQVRWVFNPIAGSDNWMVIPIPYELPSPTATPEPTPPAGFAQVTIDPNTIFADMGDNLISIGIEIRNTSTGVVQVTRDNITLSSRAGTFPLQSAAPLLPWTIEPGEFRQFELQFELPSTQDALLDVLGYTFSLDNIRAE